MLVNIGPVPAEESCDQLGANYRPDIARAECKAFIKQLKRQFGEPPEGVVFKITSEAHDFGTYHEVAIRFPDRCSDAGWDYASKCESDAWTEWDEEARMELNLS